MHTFRGIPAGFRIVEHAAVKHHSTRTCMHFPAKRPAALFAASSNRHVLPRSPRRLFVTDAVPSFLVPPAVFTALLLGLWIYKCFMTVVFQDKIIYMPYMPPFARGEKVDDYLSNCKPVQWRHTHIRSLDGTRIALCIGHIPEHSDQSSSLHRLEHIVICYFQGNGSSSPPRLPLLSSVLKSIHGRDPCSSISHRFSIVALSYRGYWTSSGRASQRGIELDAQAMLRWVQENYGSDARLVLWGQSIGAGVASTAAASYVSNARQTDHAQLCGLILETPFSSIKSMLLALYPQKWLPYRYLWPFLWNHWDTELALQRIAQVGNAPKIFLLPATRDEVVPSTEADKLERICHELKLPAERKDVIGALHTEATIRREGQESVAKFVIAATQLR